jgi:transposase InsO family protein
MGRSGTPADNAVAESFFTTLQTELLDRSDWPTRDGLHTAIFDFIEVFYNRQRRHKHLGNLSPDEYERTYQEHNRNALNPSP